MAGESARGVDHEHADFARRLLDGIARVPVISSRSNALKENQKKGGEMVLRALVGVFGLIFLVNAAGWLVDASSAAEGLGMPLLDGVGRSTQMGDIGGFFVAVAVVFLGGAYRQDGQWLRGAALLLGSAALMRTLAWLLQGAAFAPEFIVPEIVLGSIAVFAASRLGGQGDPIEDA